MGIKDWASPKEPSSHLIARSSRSTASSLMCHRGLSLATEVTRPLHSALIPVLPIERVSSKVLNRTCWAIRTPTSSKVLSRRSRCPESTLRIFSMSLLMTRSRSTQVVMSSKSPHPRSSFTTVESKTLWVNPPYPVYPIWPSQAVQETALLTF